MSSAFEPSALGEHDTAPDGTNTSDAATHDDRARGVRRFTRVLWALIAALALLLVVRSWVIAPYRIPTDSMMPTLQGADPDSDSGGDTVLVLKTAYLASGPRRWDLVAFRTRDSAGVELPGVVKRVVGLPGETVEIHDGEVVVNGERVEKPTSIAGKTTYLRRGRFAHNPVTLGEGEYFVLGDNSARSEDSRHWGPLDESQIFGRVIAVVRPWSRARWLRE